MNIELLISIQLTTYGNVSFHTSHRRRVSSAFAKQMAGLGKLARMKSIRFGRAEAEDNLVAASRKWLSSLKRKNARRLWVVPLQLKQELPERLSEAFAGSNPKGILADCLHKQELWVPHWHTTRGGKELVSYGCYPIEAKIDALPVRPAIKQLRKALRKASEFASHTEPVWCEWFERALQLLSDPKLETDLLPEEGFSQDARCLLAGANHSCVFGGMGSWNDLWFREPEQQQRYEEISEELYSAVINGLLAAANSFDGDLLDQ